MNDEAILSSSGAYTSFSYGGRTIRFMTSPRLERYTKIISWDNGYMVVMAKYEGYGKEEEEFIDLMPILRNLYIDEKIFLSMIKRVRISYAERHQGYCG